MKQKDWTFTGVGFLLGTVGVALLTSKEAKKAYTYITAACKRSADYALKKYTEFKETCEDINVDADLINAKIKEEERAQEIADAKAVLDSAEQA